MSRSVEVAQCEAVAPAVNGASITSSRQGAVVTLTYACTTPGMSFATGNSVEIYGCNCSTAASTIQDWADTLDECRLGQ